MNYYPVRGILMLRKLPGNDWEVWFTPSNGHHYVIGDVAELVGKPESRSNYAWAAQVGAAKRMQEGDTAHIYCELQVSYHTYYDHYYGGQESDISIFLVKSRTLHRTSMSKRRMKRKWRLHAVRSNF